MTGMGLVKTSSFLLVLGLESQSQRAKCSVGGEIVLCVRLVYLRSCWSVADSLELAVCGCS